MRDALTRRTWLAGTAGGLAMASTRSRAKQPAAIPFRFCLNTSTVRDAVGKSRPILELVDIAAKAG
ncbi:MAG TPA: sugar phosphate isomerase/epimerase, partial [Gemmataceae bacterium]